MNMNTEFQYPHELQTHIPPTLQNNPLKTEEKASGKAESTKRHYPYFLLNLGY